MGFQSGAGNDTLSILRRGRSHNDDPQVTDPAFFMYSLDDPPLLEPWGQGTVVLHNPAALHPVPFNAFPDSAQTVLQQGALHTYRRGWHPFTSHTLTFDIGEAKSFYLSFPGRLNRVGIGAIPEDEFRGRIGALELPLLREQSWFIDEDEFFLASVGMSDNEGPWAVCVLGRGEFFEYIILEIEWALPSRVAAVEHMNNRLGEFLNRPQRIFPDVVSNGLASDN